MRFLLSILTLAILLSVALSCDDNWTQVPVYHVERVDDEFALPYRFQVLFREDFVSSGSKNPTRGRMVPLDIYGTGTSGVYLICNNWLESDSLTSFIFYSKIEKQNAIRHVNINTPGINSDFPYDFDRDGVQEVAITYVVQNTVFVEIIDPDGQNLLRMPFASGQDRDSSGYWDGGACCFAVHDFNGDGNVELLLHCDTGYDLYPRRIVCLDWTNVEVLWSFNIATFMDHENFYIGPESARGDTVLIFGLISKGNAAITDDMSDKHSYIIALDKQGNLKWKTETGGIFSNPHVTFIDYDDDGIKDILASVRYSVSVDNQRVSGISNTCKLCIYDLQGHVLDSMQLEAGQTVASINLFDLDADGEKELLVSTSDRTVTVYNQQLQPIARYLVYANIDFWDCRDFLGNGKNQIVATSTDNKTLLLSGTFEPLAQLDEVMARAGSYSYKPADNKKGLELILAVENGHSALRLSIARNPWNLIFFRKPWLAFLAAFLPMMLIVAFVAFYSYRMRSKTRIISVARDELDTALRKLKTAQDKLVAAEKFRQAKDIAGGFAHEIRNALFPARASLSRLKRAHTADDSESSRHAVRADKSVSRAIDLTNLISTYTRLDSERMPEKVNIAKTVSEVVAANQVGIDELGVRITIQGESELTIESNRKQFYSVINNLLLNSLDALTNRTDSAIIIQWQHLGDAVELKFTDNGCGITEEDAVRVFDTFFSTKPEKGTGIGLSIVKKTVEMYGGSISVSSNQGDGVTFNLTLMPHQRDTETY